MVQMALARKWRPQNFTELLGQEHLVTALQNSLDKQRLHHAYLFTGSRGVGKTSVARLFAKALNCEQGISAQPCQKCDACQAVASGNFIDLIEIDGASKTKVEDTRELLENVLYAPNVGRFKIYLIDEVHMLSQHSFNALLKTLEEPPEHVKFLLATTDPEKLPVTILSRCLQFSLKLVNNDVIYQHLINILDAESLSYEPSAINILAHAARGSVRDSLSLLDQAIAGSSENINEQDVKKLLGYTQNDYATDIINCLIAQKPQQLIQISREIYQEGGHFEYIVDKILHTLHAIAVYQELDTDEFNNAEGIVDLSSNISPETTQLMYEIAARGREDIRLAPNNLIGFEMLLLRMLHFTPHGDKEKTTAKITHKAPKKAEIIAPETKTKPIPTPSQVNNWSELIPKLNLRGLAVNAAENAHLKQYADNVMHLEIDAAHESLFTKSVISSIETSLSNHFQQQTKINLTIDGVSAATPAQIKTQKAQEKLQQASASLEKDNFFQNLQEEFAAELVKNSIASLKD